VELKKTICDIEFEDAMSINIICRLTAHIISRTLLSKSVWEVKWLLALVRDIHKHSLTEITKNSIYILVCIGRWLMVISSKHLTIQVSSCSVVSRFYKLNWITLLCILLLELPVNFDIRKCRGDDTFWCSSKQMCVTKPQRCDGLVQCHDGSDEYLCNKGMIKTYFAFSSQ
jgi:hypothetical protein